MNEILHFLQQTMYTVLKGTSSDILIEQYFFSFFFELKVKGQQASGINLQNKYLLRWIKFNISFIPYL